MQKIKRFILSPKILIWAVVLIILYPVLRPGFFSFHDETHMVDVYEMIRSLQLGGFPPRFAPDFNFNLGHPYFNFYYHLPFYITTIFYYATHSMTESYKLMLGLSVILSASGFYFFLKNHFSKTASVFGTLVYLLSPYFAVDLYVRGAPGEMYVLALFPWAGYTLYKYLKTPDSVNLAFSAITIFLLSISHNVLLPFIYSLIFLYGLTNLYIFKSSLKSFTKIIWPFVIGVMLGAYYIIPALTEVQYISTYEQINIADHFPFIKQLIIPHWGYGPSIWGFLDDISFDIGSVNLALLLVSFLIFKFAKKEFKILLGFFWIIFGLAVILMNVRTLFFWESIRFLRLVQFPWRMLILTTISTSFIAALSIEVFTEKFKKYKTAFLLIIFASLIGLNIWHYHPSEYKEISDQKYLDLYFANQSFTPNYARGIPLSPEYLNFTEDFIPPTIWQTKRPTDILPKAEYATGSAYFEPGEVYTDSMNYQIDYSVTEDNRIVVSKAYFPGWTAISNGQKMNIEPYSEYGLIAIPVSAGKGHIDLSFEDTPIRITANLISAFAAALILVLLVGPAVARRKSK